MGYTMAVRLPDMVAPKEESITGAAAPTTIPSRSGRVLSNDIAPVTERACTIPTAAEADCRSAVKAAPISIPRKGLDRVESRCMK